jgi:DNA topoisomerase-1
VNATVPRGTVPAELSLDEAVGLLRARAEAAPNKVKRPAKKVAKKAAKKTTKKAVKKAVKKPAKKVAKKAATSAPEPTSSDPASA